MTEEKARKGKRSLFENSSFQNVFFSYQLLGSVDCLRFSVNYTYFILHKCCLENDPTIKVFLPT